MSPNFFKTQYGWWNLNAIATFRIIPEKAGSIDKHVLLLRVGMEEEEKYFEADVIKFFEDLEKSLADPLKDTFYIPHP